METVPSEAEAILIGGERIVNVGSTSEILDSVPPGTRLIDLGRNVVTPGFIDSHTHLVSFGLDLSRLNLSGAKSFDEVLEMVRETLKNRETSGPVIAVNWDQSKWADPHMPTSEELNKATGKHPVILRRVCGHIALANKAALELLPRGLQKVDWRKGLLIENAALNLNSVFPPDKKEIAEGLVKAMDTVSKIGITSIHDITSFRYYKIYKELQKENRLRVRVYICLKYKEMDEFLDAKVAEESEDDWLRVGGVKIFADGSLGARTAALSQPYKASSNLGVLNHTFDDLLGIMRKANAHGFQLFVHAIGDQAIEQVLCAYENLLVRGNPCRHRIEHFEIGSKAHIKRLKRLGIIASMQPNFVTWQYPGGMYERVLGARRLRMANRIGDVVRAGVTVAFGSDCMPPSPVYGLEGAVEHPNAEQRISIHEAVRAYTLNSAYASFDEEAKGSLVPGKLADMAVLLGSSFQSGRVGEIQVLLTIVNGEIVYSSQERSIKFGEKS